MKILVAGATGALGKQLVPRLVAAGHEVVGMTRSVGKREAVEALGARPVIADALDPEQVAAAVAEAEPEVIVHQLTALSGSLDMRHFDRDFAITNRLRTEGTDHLLAAGRAVGRQRFVAQSFAGWPFERSGAPVKSEEDPLDPAPAESMRRPTTRSATSRRRSPAPTGPRGSCCATAASTARAPRSRPDGEHDRADPQAQVPRGRRRRRGLVVRPHRGRRGGHRGRDRARPARDLQHRRR